MKKSRLSVERDRAEGYLIRAGLSQNQMRVLEKYGYFEKPASLHHHFAHKGERERPQELVPAHRDVRGGCDALERPKRNEAFACPPAELRGP